MSNTPVGISPGHGLYADATQRHAPSLASGQWRGEGVRVSVSDKSLLASAAEEMTFLRSERRSTELSRRRIQDHSRLKDDEPLDKSLAYLEKTSEIDKDKHLKPFLAQILEQPNMSSAQARRLAHQGFTDISQQYMALAYVYDQLRRRRSRRKPGAAADSDTLFGAVEAALDELIKEHGAAIQAGINVSEVASTALEGRTGKQLGSLNTLRQFYRDAVLDYGGLTNTFRKIVAEHGEQRFTESVAYLVLALGADLASEGPSLPKERLTMIIGDIYKLQSLESLDDECTELLQQLDRIFRPRTLPRKIELMEKLLSLLEKKWLSVEKLSGIAKALNIPPEMAVYFWRGFKELARLLPPKSYNDPFGRDEVLKAIQECLDLAIDSEDVL